MYKQKLYPPYKLNAKGAKITAFPLRWYAGVYMIYKDGKLRYVGFSSKDIYKTMYRHFQSWKDSRQIRVTYNSDLVKVRIIYCRTKEQADRLEKALILKYHPIDNPLQYYEYEPDAKEKKVLEKYFDSEEKPVIQHEGDMPF